MNREHVIAAAKQVGIHENWNPSDWYSVSPEQLEYFYAIAIEAGCVAEREECAKVCDEIAEADNGYWCAMTIRARGTA